jgi:iodotyrosine deiodinase
MSKHKFIPLSQYIEYDKDEMIQRSRKFYHEIKRRRTVREFSDRAISDEVIKNCLMAAGTAPNGANKQPWHFVVVSNPQIKKRIREEAEKEEHEFYTNRATDVWLADLAMLETDENKPFLETAPALIIIFGKSYDVDEKGKKIKNYYVQESVGIATGILITALHNAGLVTLTHTPSPMGFLNEILERPGNERPFLILVTGYPGRDVKVPDITKKSLKEIATFI